MPKKENETRLIRITKDAFFALVEDYIHETLTGEQLPKRYAAVLTHMMKDTLWAEVKKNSADGITGGDCIAVNYQPGTIAQLHQLGFSYRILEYEAQAEEILEYEAQAEEDQISLFDLQEEKE